MVENLNVNKNSINNKRLSRLQKIILEVLAEVYPDKCYHRRTLSHLVGRRYGNGSIDTLADKEARIEEVRKNNPDWADKMEAFLEMFLMSQRNWHFERKPDGTFDRVGEWVNEKFAVSMSRSLSNLRAQGLIRGLALVSLTEKGYEVFKQRCASFQS